MLLCSFYYWTRAAFARVVFHLDCSVVKNIAFTFEKNNTFFLLQIFQNLHSYNSPRKTGQSISVKVKLATQRHITSKLHAPAVGLKVCFTTMSQFQLIKYTPTKRKALCTFCTVDGKKNQEGFVAFFELEELRVELSSCKGQLMLESLWEGGEQCEK